MKLGPGLTFSWKRALGVTKVKRSIAKATGIPTTKSGRRNKVGRWMGMKQSLFGIGFNVRFDLHEEFSKLSFPELDPLELPQLLELKYGGIQDALRGIGSSADNVRDAFIGFQKFLYEETAA